MHAYLETLAALCGGYNYDSTSIRRSFDCLSKVIKYTVTQPASRSDADIVIYTAMQQPVHTRTVVTVSIGRRIVVARSNSSRIEIESQL